MIFDKSTVLITPLTYLGDNYSQRQIYRFKERWKFFCGWGITTLTEGWVNK